MGCCGGVAVEVDTGWVAGPEVIFWDWDGAVDSFRGLGWGFEVVEIGVVDDGGHGAGDVAPGRACGKACGEVDGNLLAVKADSGADAAEGEESLEEDEGEVSTC